MFWSEMCFNCDGGGPGDTDTCGQWSVTNISHNYGRYTNYLHNAILCDVLVMWWRLWPCYHSWCSAMSPWNMSSVPQVLSRCWSVNILTQIICIHCENNFILYSGTEYSLVGHHQIKIFFSRAFIGSLDLQFMCTWFQVYVVLNISGYSSSS